MNIRLLQKRGGVTCRGMTIVEVLLASSITAVMMGGILVIITEAVREQSLSMAQAALEQSASLVQDRVIGLLRDMSENESVVFADPVSGTAGFGRVIVARGRTPDYPREEIRFDPSGHALIYDPNRNRTGDDVRLFSSTAECTLRQFFFYPALKLGGVPDNACLNVWVEMDDNGWSSRLRPHGTTKTNRAVRTFAVRMRNP
jgi:hypothetical protein